MRQKWACGQSGVAGMLELGGVVALHYGPGSTVEYNELTVISGLVRCNGKLGLGISNIYVDNPVALQAGREVWGVDKKLADFVWSRDRQSVSVTDHGALLARIDTRLSVPIPQPVTHLLRPLLKIPYISMLGGTPIGAESFAGARLQSLRPGAAASLFRSHCHGAVADS